jgi:acyl-CoA thioester hydrolase
MVRIYSLQAAVGNAEGDAWGQLPPSGVLKLFEQAAVTAAADAGYDSEFHRKHGSAWIIRRMTLLMHAPAHLGDRLELTTWLSHMARVRGYREYRLDNVTTGDIAATGIAEWVYIDREKVAPKVIPKEVEIDFDMPGAPLNTYDPPQVESLAQPVEVKTERVAEWYECDSMGHVNNAVYTDWLDSGMRAAMHAAGWPVGELKDEGLQLRGEYFALDYKRPALPGDRLMTTTRIDGLSGRLCHVSQSVANAEGSELLAATSVYGWADSRGKPVDPPG